MTPAEFESLVFNAARRVLNGGRLEDDLFEAKREVPPFEKLALQVAGHANSARHQPIIWILGLDEDNHAVHPIDADLADLSQRLASRFDGEPPGILHARRVDLATDDDASVLAIAFETSWPPYVVRRSEGGDWSAVVPWRDATRTRAVRRAELLQVLVEEARAPEVRPLEAVFSVTDEDYNPDRKWGTLRGRLLFSLSEMAPNAFLPYADMRLDLTVGKSDPLVIPIDDVEWGDRELPPVSRSSPTGLYRRVRHPEAVYTSASGITVEWVGSAPFSRTIEVPADIYATVARRRTASVSMDFPVLGTDAVAHFSATLRRRSSELTWNLA